ncbi:conserved membrane hypothetical protein [Flavobacterium sp. 9AF]|uniref:hypothetical protein n=1 Tax=Flavobacterium sp. 9AF TaxID=2653142 RepID=UPI0012F46FB7|nr:hypothetical protein [Flavobacterium sp. 9AF]VXB55586.1 conserved membrane hypothetical protein [Flavobacterium sp. 9AF]
MKLTLQPCRKNLYPLSGILIKGDHPLVWLQQLQILEITIIDYMCYSIPGKKANELYGCLVILPVEAIKKAYSHLRVQCYEEKIFIPEFTTITPFINKEEANKILGANFHFLHPELGLIELEEAIDWGKILNPIRQINVKLKTPYPSVFIPKQLQSVHVEYDEETILKALEEPISEQEYLESLPFDMKKLMAGNKKEMEKFLAFMDKNPEAAMKYALPLDTLGTARGNHSGVFQFGGSFKESFSRFFGWTDNAGNPITHNASEKSSKILNLLLLVIGIFFMFSLIKSFTNYTILDSKSITKDFSGSSLGNLLVLILFIGICSVGIIRLWMQSKFDFKGKTSTINKVIMVLILLLALYYLISFMYSNFGLTKWHSLLILLFISVLIYRLFNVEKEIFKSKDEDGK